MYRRTEAVIDFILEILSRVEIQAANKIRGAHVGKAPGGITGALQGRRRTLMAAIPFAILWLPQNIEQLACKLRRSLLQLGRNAVELARTFAGH